MGVNGDVAGGAEQRASNYSAAAELPIWTSACDSIGGYTAA